MYISKLKLEGYKNCKECSEIEFNKGLNILVGENACGKTTIINALRLILKESEFSNMNIYDEDFYSSFYDNIVAENIKIDVEWNDLSDDEKITFLTWCDADFNAKLHLEVNNKKTPRGYYKKTIWGGASKASAFEEETYDCIDCIYLPPLRDAEEKLTNGRKSRLAILLEHQYKNEKEKQKLEDEVNKINKEVTENKDGKFNEINKARNDINSKMKDSMGSMFSQSINLQFVESSFTSILRNIKMMFFPEIEEIDDTKFRDIAINSLGYNNLLYIATILAEINAVGKDNNLFTLLLIEEPEAHLHPQLQTKLMKYFESVVKDNSNIQIVVTTHSPVLASSVSIDNLIHIEKCKYKFESTNLSKIKIEDNSKKYINRWLDVTKSTLLFSRGVILVEGISETILMSEFAKIVLKKYNEEKETDKKLPSSLEDAGVSVININGINFKHFYQLFCNIKDEENKNLHLNFRCSGITDNDPAKIGISKKDKDGNILKDEKGNEIKKYIQNYPQKDDEVDGGNTALELIEYINKSENSRLYSSPYKTFEYDLAMEGNTQIMAEVLKEVWPNGDENNKGVKKDCVKIITNNNQNSDELRDNAIFLYKHIDSDDIGKGIYSQQLAEKISAKKQFEVPKYISNAIIWACGGDIGD